MKTSPSFKSAIQNYIDAEKLNDTAFAEATKSEKHNIDDCCGVIMNKAKELAEKSNAFAMTDGEVFLIVKDYYLNPAPEKVEPVACKVQVSAPKEVKPTKETPKKDDGQMSIFDLL